MNYLTLKQTAAKFNVSVRTIARLVKERKIPHTYAAGKIRFPEAVLEEWAQAPEVTAAAWFSGIIEPQPGTEKGCNAEEKDNEERADNLGRDIFLQNQE